MIVAVSLAESIAALAIIVFVIGWFALALTLWGLAFFRLYQRQPILQPTRLPSTSPDLSAVLVAVGSFVVLITIFQGLFLIPVNVALRTELAAQVEANSEAEADANTDTQTAVDAEAETAPDAEAETADAAEETATPVLTKEEAINAAIEKHPRFVTTAIVCQSVAIVLASALSWLWLSFRGLGSSLWSLIPRAQDLVIGVAATVMLLPVVYLVQGVLIRFIDYQHDIVDMLSQAQALWVIVAMAVSAAIIAPLFEEYFFRGLFQGWLQSLYRTAADATEVEQPATEVITTDERRPYWPIIASSALFSAAHFGQGPAPVSLFVLSLGLGYIVRQTGSIWPGIIVHFGLNGLTTIGLIVTQVLAK